MTRLLYIIKGLHTDTEAGELNTQALAAYEIQMELVQEIARKTKCTTYFDDSVSEEMAKWSNSLLERIVLDSDFREDIYRKMDEQFEQSIVSSDIWDQMKRFSELWREGIKIKYQKTEDPIEEETKDPKEIGLAYLDILYGKVQIKDFLYAITYLASGKDPEDFHYIEPFKSVLLEHRDKNIFENIRAMSQNVNILSIGIDHKLKDFEREKHDFEIYQVEVDFHNGRVSISGSLPSIYKSFIDKLTEKYGLLNNMRYNQAQPPNIIPLPP